MSSPAAKASAPPSRTAPRGLASSAPAQLAGSGLEPNPLERERDSSLELDLAHTGAREKERETEERAMKGKMALEKNLTSGSYVSEKVGAEIGGIVGVILQITAPKNRRRPY